MKKKGLFRRKKEFEEIEYKPKTVKEMLINLLKRYLRMKLGPITATRWSPCTAQEWIF